MRTKTLLLSTLLGAIGTVAVQAQSVYSLNAVGYITVTLEPGFNIITCPLTTSPDNTVGTVLNNSAGNLTGCSVYFWNPASGYSEDIAKTIGVAHQDTTNANGWSFNGTNLASPGVGFWFNNVYSTNVSVIFYGTVPSSTSVTLVSGFNLVGSGLPVTGDIVTNSLSAFTNYNIGDDVYTYTPGVGYTEFVSSSNPHVAVTGYHTNWSSTGDPSVSNDYTGFWYDNKVGTTVTWVENYSVGQ